MPRLFSVKISSRLLGRFESRNVILFSRLCRLIAWSMPMFWGAFVKFRWDFFFIFRFDVRLMNLWVEYGFACEWFRIKKRRKKYRPTMAKKIKKRYVWQWRKIYARWFEYIFSIGHWFIDYSFCFHVFYISIWFSQTINKCRTFPIICIQRLSSIIY